PPGGGNDPAKVRSAASGTALRLSVPNRRSTPPRRGPPTRLRGDPRSKRRRLVQGRRRGAVASRVPGREKRRRWETPHPERPPPYPPPEGEGFVPAPPETAEGTPREYSARPCGDQAVLDRALAFQLVLPDGLGLVFRHQLESESLIDIARRLVSQSRHEPAAQSAPAQLPRAPA